MNQSNHSLVSTYSIANLGLVDLDSASQLSGMHPEMILEVARERNSSLLLSLMFQAIPISIV